jgi:DNA-binding NtrC family response regulator
VKPTILVIDDDAEIRYSLNRVLGPKGYDVQTASSGEEGIKVANTLKPAVILLDNRMQGMTGIETLQHLRTGSPHSMVILMTAYGTTQTAIEAMKFGAFDYVIKPFSPAKILELVSNAAAAHAGLDQAKEGSPASVLEPQDLAEGIVGQSEAMQEVFKMIGQVAATDATVLVTGESGTGKELIARAIYRHSLRVDAPYLAVNCAAIPENLIESELFGHEKGSFTGATQTRVGKFETCNKGTLFLDEIGDMTLATQTKILRAIQEGEIQRVGGNKTINVDVRVIAATNKDLNRMIQEGDFREDLYYRLSVVRLRLPPLRERCSDIPTLVGFILQKLAKAEKIKKRKMSAEAMEKLEAYHWPGNVRELENIIYRSAVVANGDTILVKDFPSEFLSPHDGKAKPYETKESGLSAQEDLSPTMSSQPLTVRSPKTEERDEQLLLSGSMSLQEAMELVYAKVRDTTKEPLLTVIEKDMVRLALNETSGNQLKAAEILGITRSTLRKRIDSYGIRY